MFSLNKRYLFTNHTLILRIHFQGSHFYLQTILLSILQTVLLSSPKRSLKVSAPLNHKYNSTILTSSALMKIATFEWESVIVSSAPASPPDPWMLVVDPLNVNKLKIGILHFIGFNYNLV